MRPHLCPTLDLHLSQVQGWTPRVCLCTPPSVIAQEGHPETARCGHPGLAPDSWVPLGGHPDGMSVQSAVTRRHQAVCGCLSPGWPSAVEYGGPATQSFPKLPRAWLLVSVLGPTHPHPQCPRGFPAPRPHVTLQTTRTGTGPRVLCPVAAVPFPPPGLWQLVSSIPSTVSTTAMASGASLL